MNLCARCMSLMDDGATVCDRCGHDSKDTKGAIAPPATADAPAPLALPAVVIASPPPARAGGPLSGRELAVLLLAVAGAGVVTLSLLMLRGNTATEAAASPVPAAVTAAAPHADVRKASLAEPRWTSANSKLWVGSAKNSVAFELPADDRVPVWTRFVQPLLVVRCVAGKVEVFVYTDTAAKIEPQTEDHTVRYALDEAAETSERWTDAAGHDGLFAPDGAALAARLAKARTMRFGFTPHNAEPVTARFNVDGLSALLGSASRQCAPPPAAARQAATPSRHRGSR